MIIHRLIAFLLLLAPCPLLLQFEINIELFLPGKALLIELFHEGIGVEFLNVMHAGLVPKALEEHHGAYHGRHTRRVADALHACLFVSGLMRAVIIYIICVLLPVSESADAAADARLAIVVLAEVLRVGKHSLEELQGNYLHFDCLGGMGHGARGRRIAILLLFAPYSLLLCKRCLIHHFVDAAHADVLDDVEVSEVLLPEGHPEACTLDGGIVDDERLYLLVVKQVALLGTDAGIGQRLVYLHWFRLDVLAVLPVEALLGYLADVDFGVEVRGEGFVVVASVAVHDVEVLHLVEVMFAGIGCEDAGHARVEATAQNGAETSFLEAFAVSPLPRVLEVRLVLGLVVGRVEVVAARLQAGLHDGEVLIGQGEVHHDVGLIAAEELDELFHAVGIHLSCLDLRAVLLVEDFCQSDALLLGATGYHHFGERVGILTHLMSCHGSNAASSNYQYSDPSNT